jgi:hypothetical protein
VTDRREQILARLLAILESVGGVRVAVRNRGELPPAKRPAVILLDADEIARTAPPQQRGRLTMMPNLVDMSPEIYVVMDQREPQNESIGEDMNALRIAIMKAIMSDDPLAAILGSNGDIQYNGCETDMASGRSLEGQMHIRMTFTYALRPSEL